jgi:hypothetical protein
LYRYAEGLAAARRDAADEVGLCTSNQVDP